MKTPSLIISALLIVGLTSCSKEESITPASDTNALVEQRMAQTTDAKNPFKGKEYVVMAFVQNKVEKEKMKKIKLRFKDSGLLEVKGSTVNYHASWSYSGNRLIIRSDGRNEIVNHLSSDVWNVTATGRNSLHLKAIHMEMVKEMDIANMGVEPESDLSSL